MYLDNLQKAKQRLELWAKTQSDFIHIIRREVLGVVLFFASFHQTLFLWENY